MCIDDYIWHTLDIHVAKSAFPGKIPPLTYHTPGNQSQDKDQQQDPINIGKLRLGPDVAGNHGSWRTSGRCVAFTAKSNNCITSTSDTTKKAVPLKRDYQKKDRTSRCCRKS
jgi:hypothetical protein